jgi:hypothetical protein
MDTRRRPGRPRLDTKSATPSADVHLTLPASDYDHVEAIARQRRESIQAAIRRGIKRLIHDERGI